MKYDLQRIKDLSFENFGLYGDTDNKNCFSMDVVTPIGEEVNISTVWMDRTGRFVISDEKAVSEWGLENVVTFIEEFGNYLKEKEII